MSNLSLFKEEKEVVVSHFKSSPLEYIITYVKSLSFYSIVY